MSHQRPTNVVLLCGLPAVGKSTLAKYIADHMDRTTKLIEYDQLSGADASLEAWRLARRQAVGLLSESIGTYDFIILDDNFYLRSMRKDIVRVLRDHSNVRFGMIHLDVTDLSVCLERNQYRNHPVPKHILLSMADRFEPPMEDSPYYWDVNVLTLDATRECTWDDQWDTIHCFLQTKLFAIPYPISNEITPLTLSQRRDGYWRAAVRSIGQYDPKLAQSANLARKHCLQSNQSTLQDFLQFGDWIPEEELPVIQEKLQALGDPPVEEDV